MVVKRKGMSLVEEMDRITDSPVAKESYEIFPVERITVDESLQARDKGLDTDHLQGMIVKLETGNEIKEAVILFLTPEGKYLLADGFHRVEAYRHTKRTEIRAVIHKGTWADARLYAESANMEHGLRFNNDDKRAILESRLVRGFYENENGYLASNQVIADSLNTTPQTANTWIREIVTRKNLRVNLTIRVGADGIERDMSKSAESNQQRAAELAERRAAEEAAEERKRRTAFEEQVRAEAERFAALRAMPVIGKVKYIAERLMARVYNSEIAARLGEPFKEMALPDEQKRLGYYRQVANARYKFKPQDEERLNQEMKLTHPYTWYQSLLDLPPHIWEKAEREAWDEDAMQAWLASFYKNQTGQQVGMAQPKNPDLPYQPPAATGRHRLTEVAATETHEEIPPCPFVVGQWVRLVDSEMTGKVKDTRRVDGAWQDRVDGGWQVLTDIYLIDKWYWAKELTDATPAEPPLDDSIWAVGNAAEDAAVDEALEISLRAGEEASHHLDYDETDEPELALDPAPSSNGGYKPSNGTQTQMAENYMALMKLIQQTTDDLFALKKFDFNLQYLQTPEALGGIWDTLAVMRDQAMETFTVVADRLNTMADQGLPYDPTLAQETLNKRMQRV